MAVYITKIRQKANTLWKSVIIFKILRISDCGFGNWILEIPPLSCGYLPLGIEPEKNDFIID